MPCTAVPDDEIKDICKPQIVTNAVTLVERYNYKYIVSAEGDVDGDGILTANDSAVALQCVLNSSGLSELEKIYIDSVGNVDGDSILTANDCAVIMSWSL